MVGPESSEDSGTRLRPQEAACGVDELIVRAQRLSDRRRPAGGYPLEWLVEASQAGDLTAIAIAALRSDDR
jgi:hypothetical protein